MQQFATLRDAPIELAQTAPVAVGRRATLTFTHDNTNQPTFIRVTTPDGVVFLAWLRAGDGYLYQAPGWSGAQRLPTFTSSPDGFEYLPGEKVSVGFDGAYFCLEQMPFMLCRDDVANRWRFDYRPAHGGQGERYAG